MVVSTISNGQTLQNKIGAMTVVPVPGFGFLPLNVSKTIENTFEVYNIASLGIFENTIFFISRII